jgi:hypothetical protein
MKLRLLFVISLAILSCQCVKTSSQSTKTAEPGPDPTATPNSPIDLTNASEIEFHENVGRLVIVRGKFSMRGVISPFVSLGREEVYITVEPKGSFYWDKKYSRMEGHDVRLTGTLQFRHFEPSPDQHPPDYFYMRLETSKVELLK